MIRTKTPYPETSAPLATPLPSAEQKAIQFQPGEIFCDTSATNPDISACGDWELDGPTIPDEEIPLEQFCPECDALRATPRRR